VPEISFYVLATESIQERCLFASKLIEKAYRSGAFAYVLTDSPEQNQLIDDLLWTFRPGSFIPHQVFTGELPITENTVLIGSSSTPEGWLNLLINLSSKMPQDFQKVNRIIEILDNSEGSKALGRLRYRQYQQTENEITTHNM
jgi:DNA polymerase III subunit chi